MRCNPHNRRTRPAQCPWGGLNKGTTDGRRPGDERAGSPLPGAEVSIAGGYPSPRQRSPSRGEHPPTGENPPRGQSTRESPVRFADRPAGHVPQDGGLRPPLRVLGSPAEPGIAFPPRGGLPPSVPTLLRGGDPRPSPGGVLRPDRPRSPGRPGTAPRRGGHARLTCSLRSLPTPAWAEPSVGHSVQGPSRTRPALLIPRRAG